MLSMWLIILLLLEVQDELSKSSDAEKASKLISSLISSSETFRSSSKLTDVVDFKTEDDIVWSWERRRVNFFAMIYDC